MAKAGLQGLSILEGPQDPPASPAPQAPQTLQVPIQPTPYMLSLNWCHVKPKLSGKPDKDAETFLLRTNDWMDSHRFWKMIKFRDFV